MNASSKIAILDVDGTLVPGALGIELLRALTLVDGCSRDWAGVVFEILDDYRAGRIDLSTMSAHAYRAFALALAGREVAAVEARAREVWARRRHAMFEFVPELLAALRELEFEPMLISGSPIEMVRLVADELGIDAAHGAVFERRDGVYTGSVALASGAPGRKVEIFAAATCGREAAVDRARCFALGDSMADLALFERVGAGLVFEPEPELAELAANRGLPVATRACVVAQTRALLGAPIPTRLSC